MSTTIDGNLVVSGNISCSGSIAGTGTRDFLATETGAVFPLYIDRWRIWDAFQTLLTTPTADDLGITAGAFATGTPYVYTGDVKASTVTRYARTYFTLPAEYVSGQSVTAWFAAGMLTTVSDTSCTLDVEAYKVAGTTLKTGSDLVLTAAQSINSLTFAAKSFTVDGSALTPGVVLDIRVAISVVDGATATAVIGAIANANMLLSIKG